MEEIIFITIAAVICGAETWVVWKKMPDELSILRNRPRNGWKKILVMVMYSYIKNSLNSLIFRIFADK
jgi:hypothetical protein